MKTTKGGKVMNPTDAYRKEIRKKEIKRNKKERKKVRDVGILKKDPESLKEQIDKLEKLKGDGALDKARKHKKRQLEDTLNMVMKKRKEYEEKLKEKGETPVMFSHLGPVRRPIAKEAHQPEDSVYYHPTLNPTGAPPPGKPHMYKSLLEPIASSEQEEAGPSVAPPPVSGELSSSSLPLPPPPPLPSMPPPIDGQITIMPLPPPPLPVSPAQHPSRTGDEKSVDLEDDYQNKTNQATGSSILLPPLPPGLPPKPDSPTKLSKPIFLPPPPPFLPHMLPPVMTRLPPPPPGPPPAHLLPSAPSSVPHLPPGLPPVMSMMPAYPFPHGPVPLAKPSYVKSAAPTVVKRPLAHHTPELTAMVPASVLVKRQTMVPKAKSKPQISSSNPVSAPVPSYNMGSVKQGASATSAVPKGRSIDESYMAFLEDMKELGALDG